ncbi:hypothetical protein EVAR_102290_1 [Eumeta japonica]|uniref:MCMDC2 N-terminal domain-containing protein n=1 Tax=Eumeta variegata TaxID=151549 RepID=A0A4C1WGN7_EUMVA|nr:hypothetical protein EVAR_102290_1 [Eumeta japonica]
MEVRCELLVYFEKKGYTVDMRNKCSEFLEDLSEKTIRRFPPLRYICSINVMELLEENPNLGTLLFAEPMEFINMADNILYACLRTYEQNPLLESVRDSQVKIILRLSSVPELFVPTNQHHYNGLVTFKGMLIDITKPVHYAFHTVWSCPEECEDSEVILHYLPECAPKCCVCKSVLFENSALRRCGEEVKAIFTVENDFLSKTLPITDDLILKLRLGNKYFLTGTVVKKKVYLFSVEELQTLAAPLTAPIPGGNK